jgi:hypothetical protein
MTPKQVTTIDVNEVKEIEIRCECGMLIRLPLPLKAELPAEQACPSCSRMLWARMSPVLSKITALIAAINNWNSAGYKDLSLRFVLTEKSVSD